MLVGLTGGIASGKSLIATLFEEYGFFTLDADILAKVALQLHEKEVEEYFGTIVRKELADIIFSDEVKRKKLESIIHPEVSILERLKVGELKARFNDPIIITHAALLVETGSYKRYDKLIVIDCNEEVQIERLMQRNNINRVAAKNMIAAQMRLSDKLELADIILDNNSTFSNARQEVQRIAEYLTLIKGRGIDK